MSSSTPDTAGGHWLTASEVARASQLREDLVERFLPAAEPPEALYSGDLVAVARFVKQLTDLGTPAPAIEVAVAELRSRPDAAFKVALGTGRHRAPFDMKRRKVWLSVGASVVAALVVAGITSTVFTGDDQKAETAAPAPRPEPVPADVIAPAVMNIATIPTRPDPVCAQWERASASYGAKLQAWVKTDPRIPASRWSPKQRAVTLAVIPVMRDEATGLRKLADKAEYPLLAELLRGQAKYEDAYADRLPNFKPGDQALWKAASSLSGTVKAICSAAK
ncbi:hypothetical protein MMAG44476_09957 [Mycolicibacterium mageritense DSM 44476 = CIP 104973]|nr:hypothetical protein [Mycolicibacterium mageritense]MCC9179269.1 hypothetical protein [Mycolicibacterium mageritense]TXI63035.1 MAG: hypothetical protein E6Q55_10800 [Mycolicibacterium mageritense]CDO26678.1 hypothetical protein BN978_07235 [Mycolicibacterium mageritense DSM 44476 = CIP 104973]